MHFYGHSLLVRKVHDTFSSDILQIFFSKTFLIKYVLSKVLAITHIRNRKPILRRHARVREVIY